MGIENWELGVGNWELGIFPLSPLSSLTDIRACLEFAIEEVRDLKPAIASS
ncbi:MAG: hypothetical protein F6K47_01850 [Symploca sp. SIO2E6]|nr:hypothetical protein [Symploca sp. SIO2E6]